MPDSKRQAHLDMLRAFACVAVVVLHVSAGGATNAQVTDANWHVCNLWDGSVRWAVPVFVMISGSLFLASNKPLGTILRGNVARLVVAFAFWSLLYALHGLYAGNLNLNGFLYNLVIGHFHMWYLPMLMGLYVLTPLLRPIARSDEHGCLFLTLALVFDFLLPQVTGVLGCFSETLAGVLTKVIDGFQLDFVLGYSAYYVLGYRLSHLRRRVSPARLVLVAVTSTFVTVASTWGLYVYTGSFTELMYRNMTVNVLACSAALFLLARNGQSIVGRLMGNRLLSSLSRRSFGIYLVHPLVIDALRDVLGLDWSTFGAAISVPLVSTLVVAISLVASAALSKVPVLGRYVA